MKFNIWKFFSALVYFMLRLHTGVLTLLVLKIFVYIASYAVIVDHNATEKLTLHKAKKLDLSILFVVCI